MSGWALQFTQQKRQNMVACSMVAHSIKCSFTEILTKTTTVWEPTLCNLEIFSSLIFGFVLDMLNKARYH